DLCRTEWRRVEEEPYPNLRLGRLFLEREHIDQYITRAERELSAHLRFAPESIRAESIRSLHRARSGRIPDRSYRLGFSHLRRLRTRLSLHDLARTLQRSIAQAQQLLRIRYADGLPRHLHSADFQGNECAHRPRHFRARHRGAASAEQPNV